MPTILGDKVTVAAGGSTLLTLNDPALLPANAGIWGADRLDGWDSTSDIDFTSSARTGIDGDVKGDYDAVRARHLLLGGYFLANTREQAEGLWDGLVTGLPRNQELTLTRAEGVSKFVRCYRSTKIDRVESYDRVIANGVGYWMRWETTLTCLDPLKYATTAQSGSAGVAGQSIGGRTYPRTYPMTYSTGTGVGNAILLTNSGTAPTAPLVTLTGPLPKGAWRVANDTTLKDFRMNVGVLAGETLVIDFRKETALLNGQLVFGAVTGDFWDVVRGQNTIRLYADFDAAAGITASINSAWE